MARYRLEDIFTEYLNRYNSEYPGITVGDMIAINTVCPVISTNTDWVIPVTVGELESESFMEIEKFDAWYSKIKEEGATHVVLSPRQCRAIKNSDMSIDLVIHSMRYGLQRICEHWEEIDKEYYDII